MTLTDEQKKVLDEAGAILSQAGFTHIDLSGIGLSGFGGAPTTLRREVEILLSLTHKDSP